jgi:poly-gamma-glutamate synthesis protein (capsule biosynthesis protein)
MPERLVVVALSAAMLLQPGALDAQVDPSGSLSADGRFTAALTGDAIITRRLSPYKEPQFVDMIELVRSADVSFTNLEMLLHDYEPFPAQNSGGTYMRADPLMAKELVWAGFDMVSLANNHTGDYGALGAELTREHVAEAGLVGAGSGDNLFEAREAKFLETHDGRVALIATSSSITEGSMAGPPRGGVRGRPGLSPLRIIEGPEMLEREDLEVLRQALQTIGQEVTPEGQPLEVFGTELVPGDETGEGESRPRAEDMEAIGHVVRNASRLAEYVIVSIHAHNQGPYLKTFAHAMIDAGADVFVGHGPHFLTGVEIYKGKPIMYSLGDFIFQNETLLRLPYENYERYGQGFDRTAWVADFNAERYDNDTSGFPARPEIWESVVAMPTFEGERLVSLELHPITLGFGKPTTVRGRPMFAEGELAEKIINDIIEASREHGTVVEWVPDRGIGIVRIPDMATAPR